MSYRRKEGCRLLQIAGRPDSRKGSTLCDRLADTIFLQTGVSCECELAAQFGVENVRNLVINARSYADYLLARKVAIERFSFEAASISFSKGVLVA